MANVGSLQKYFIAKSYSIQSLLNPISMFQIFPQLPYRYLYKTFCIYFNFMQNLSRVRREVAGILTMNPSHNESGFLLLPERK